MYSFFHRFLAQCNKNFAVNVGCSYGTIPNLITINCLLFKDSFDTNKN